MCAQLYIQKAAQPDTWVMSGAPSATAIWLSRATPINYSDGATDTLPANTPAAVTGGGTSFDRTHDVYVPYTVKGSGVLSIVKESLLPTLTDDYAPLARVELHGIKPYQPEPYLASGGLGGPTGTPSTSTVLTSSTAAKALSLWTGSTNAAPPAGWETSAFDDSAWSAAHVATIVPTSPASTGVGGTVLIWASATPASATERILVRQHFSVPAGLPSSAALQLGWDDYLDAIYVNGTAISGVPTTQDNDWGGATSLAIPAADLIAGADNVLAIVLRNAAPNNAWLSYALAVTMGGARGAGTAREGDILYYHNGQWIDLPIGTSGQELTVVAGDPAWTDQPADSDYSDPLTTKGDLLTRSASATVRLGVGSNGQVVTADSAAADGLKWATPSASGVTSIDVAVPAPLSSAGGPITSTGTITLSWTSGQAANRVLASPNGTTGAVSLRALVAADIPSLPASQITTGQLATARGGTGLDASAVTDGQVLIGQTSDHTFGLATLTAGSGVTITNAGHGITIAASGGSGTVTSVTLTVPGFLSVSGSPITTSGTLAVTLATQSAATVFAGPASGSAAAPTFRALQGSDLPPAAAAGGHIHAHGHFL